MGKDRPDNKLEAYWEGNCGGVAECSCSNEKCNIFQHSGYLGMLPADKHCRREKGKGNQDCKRNQTEGKRQSGLSFCKLRNSIK
ncbi:hypothetical protein SLA2020_480720 [Shorea laevis]